MKDEEGIPGLAVKLNHLFDTVPGPGRYGRYSNDAAASALSERGVSVSGVHMSHLRSGRRDNPSARLLAAIGDVFGVPISYFFDDELERRIRRDLNAVTAMNDPRGKRLMVLADGLSPASLELVESLMDRLRKLEGVNPHANHHRG